MNYNYTINDVVTNAIRQNYERYFNMITDQTKLGFVKQIKEDTGLGLKEAKTNTDIIFGGGVEMFKKIFGIKEQRRQKLDELKKRLLTNELVEMIKSSSPEKLEETFSEMNIYIIEDVLNVFLNVIKK